MSTHLRIFLSVLLLLSITVNANSAEAEDVSELQADFQVSGTSPETEAPANGGMGDDQTIFDEFKQKMMTAVKEHERLAAENETLRAQLIKLRFQVEKKERQKGITPATAKASGPGLKIKDRELSESSLLLGKDAKTPIEEAQEIYLSGQTRDVGDGQRLKELFLYDLQYQVQELELDIKLKEYWLKNVDEERKLKMDALNADVAGIKEQEQAMFQKVLEQEQIAADAPKQIELLKTENRMLKHKIQQLQQAVY